MFKSINIQSHKGIYSVFFENEIASILTRIADHNVHFIIDANIAALYSCQLKNIIAKKSTIIIEATEENKSIQNILPIFDRLISDHIRREHQLIAIGGGIIQDITCFLASTLLRGLSWKFVPTTLLAQADSCIGSKSSINLGRTKNIIGTFNPPEEIFISTVFLNTLAKKDFFSGIGEILKVHAIDSPRSFDKISMDYERLFSDKEILLNYIYKSLKIKKKYIEKDEFDLSIRNIFNYGHSFGHAIESSTNFAIPHGIAVSMGMDIANYISFLRGSLSSISFERMHKTLRKNYKLFSKVTILQNRMFSALLKDKKNTTKNLVLILPIEKRISDKGRNAKFFIKRVEVKADEIFNRQLKDSLNQIAI